MSTDKIINSRLFCTSIVEGRIDLDEKYDKAFQYVQKLTLGLSEKDAHEAFNRALSEDRKVHDEICIGLLIGILSEPKNATQHFHDLMLVSRDSLKHVTDTLIQPIIGERYLRLSETSRRQLLWLVRELVRKGIANVEGVVWCLLRQMAGGDLSNKNIWLSESLVDILMENRPWLDKFPVIVASVAYTYLRILEDHMASHLLPLRQKEVAFVVALLRERFQDCLMIGRDLVRLLQNIAKIPEIEILWKDILLNPTSLAPSFTGVLQLLQMRTSRRFLVVRLTPEMEKKMVFLCTDVKFGAQKRYQDWFQRQYLNTPESQTLRCDLIRFIIGCIHPSNEVLCSDIIPRWAVIGWLLTPCSAPPATAANCKLALFYDWLVYNSELDNIMNIEPGVLVMYHSLRPHPALTATLLDFMCRICMNFYPTFQERIRAGVANSLRQILEKRVVQSLEPLFQNPRMDPELRRLIRDIFPEFCVAATDGKEEGGQTTGVTSVTRMDLMSEAGLDFNIMSSMSANDDICHLNNSDDMEAAFSDEDDTGDTQGHKGKKRSVSEEKSQHLKEKPTEKFKEKFKEKSTDKVKEKTVLDKSKEKLKEKSFEILKEKVNPVLEKGETETLLDLTEHLNVLENDMRTLVIELQADVESRSRCDHLQKLCDLIFSDDLDQEEAQHLAKCLTVLLTSDLLPGVSLLPKDVSPETVQDSLNRPLYVLFDNLTTLPEDDHRRQPILQLLSEMHRTSPQMGYHLLYFLKASNLKVERSQEDSEHSTFLPYRDLCRASGQKDFSSFLLQDLQTCGEKDPRLLSWFVPDLYSSFPKHVLGNVELLQVLLERLDSTQLHDLVCMVLQGSLQMFDNGSFGAILEKSLQWETVEQLFLWQLARAHEIPVDCCLAVMPKLRFTSHAAVVNDTHAEALSNILMMLRRESPSEILLRALLNREFRPEDPTVATILQYWVQRYEDKMAKLIHDVVNNKHQPSPAKRKRTSSHNSKPNAIPLDQVLSHLNHLRTACGQTSFFSLTSMQEALQTAQNQCSESHKKRYCDLFALIEEEERGEAEPQRKGGKGSGRGGRKGKGRRKHESDSEEESSEEEDVKKPSRKRKKNHHQVASDSD